MSTICIGLETTVIIETFGWSNHVSIDSRLSCDASSVVVLTTATLPTDGLGKSSFIQFTSSPNY